MKTFTNNEGWTFNHRPRGMDLFSIPNETIKKDDQYWAYLCHIAHSDGLTRQVYFVDMLDRNAWITMAQCQTKQQALDFLSNLIKGKTHTYQEES